MADQSAAGAGISAAGSGADRTAGNTGGAAGAPAAPRVRISVVQRAFNYVMRGLLRTPGVAAGIGSRLVTLYVVGRKSGKRYSIVVAYTRHDGGMLIGTPFGWARNLRTGEPVAIRLKGRLRQAGVTAYRDEADVVNAYAAMCRDNHTFAKFNKIGLDTAGNPSPADLHQAWLAGARAFLLNPGA
jgi:hypothetical protein